MNDTTITLRAIIYGTDASGFETETATDKTVYAERLSVGRSEFYSAIQAGVKVDIVFRMRALDYNDETVIIHGGKTYKVVRTYAVNDDWIEITAARK